MGRNTDNKSTEKPETKIVVVIINAEPVLIMVALMASTLSIPCLNSLRYLKRKCKLSSTAIPRATENVIAVGGRIEIPSHDKMPNTVKIGIRFVMRLAKSIDFFRNINAITMLIKTSAMPRLFTRDCTR